MTRIVWADPIKDLLLELLEHEREIIFEPMKYLRRFPHMYPVRTKGGFRRHRWFLAGNWLFYYRVAGGTAYTRGRWPSRIP
jgi:hypothetical protein